MLFLALLLLNHQGKRVWSVRVWVVLHMRKCYLGGVWDWLYR